MTDKHSAKLPNSNNALLRDLARERELRKMNPSFPNPPARPMNPSFPTPPAFAPNSQPLIDPVEEYSENPDDDGDSGSESLGSVYDSDENTGSERCLEDRVVGQDEGISQLTRFHQFARDAGLDGQTSRRVLSASMGDQDR
jgi:hypothetical protein